MKARIIFHKAGHLLRYCTSPGASIVALRPMGHRATLLLLCGCFLLPAIAGAVAREADREPKEKIKTFRINIQRLQEGIATQQEQYHRGDQTRKKACSRNSKTLDRRLSDQVARLKTLLGRLSSQQVLITEKSGS